MEKGRVNERTFYDALMLVIREFGGTGVQEVSFNSVPDILFNLGGHKWILSVKIGQDSATIKSAFLQYLRHKEESGIQFGMLLLLPESIRSVKPEEEDVVTAVRSIVPAVLIDAGSIKEELRDRSFPSIIDFLKNVVLIRLIHREYSHYPLPLVITLLKQQVSEMMSDINLEESEILSIVTDRELLMDLGELKRDDVEDVTRFLASYILMSQILFLRLFVSARKNLFPVQITPITPHKLRTLFGKILEINYRPIYEVDVLDSLPEKFLHDTFALIWGLEVEKLRYELPGRIFHELMPSHIRKMLAAFYTRPQAADILSELSIIRSDDTVLDLACGSGTILVAAYRNKRHLFRLEGKSGEPHKRFCEEEIFGADIMPFAVHLTTANLSAMEAGISIERTQIIQGDSLKLVSGKFYSAGIHSLIHQGSLFHEVATGKTSTGDSYEVPLKTVKVILMNPPFTKTERGIRHFVDMDRFKKKIGGEVGLWGHFIALANFFLDKEGIYGAVIPINVLRGRESEKVRRILFNEWSPLYVLKPTKNYAFSESSEYRDIIVVSVKRKPLPDHKVKFVLIKKDLNKLSEVDTNYISTNVKNEDFFRSENIDINTYYLSELSKRFNNMMWFCGVTDFKHRDILESFYNRFSKKLCKISLDILRTGFRPDKDVSKFLFITRNINDSTRVQQSFLQFSNETRSSVSATSPLGISYNIKKHL